MLLNKIRRCSTNRNNFTYFNAEVNLSFHRDDMEIALLEATTCFAFVMVKLTSSLFTDFLYFPVPSLCSIFSLFFLPCIPLLKWANKSFLDPIISYSVISASSSLHYTLLERIVFIHCQHFVTCPIPHSTLCRPHCLPLHSLSRMAGTFQPTTLHTTPLPGILSHTWPC